MEVELRKNGTLQIRLKASDGIDQVILDSMLARAQNGRPVTLVRGEECVVVSMEAD
jgi:hypothetical protein